MPVNGEENVSRGLEWLDKRNKPNADRWHPEAAADAWQRTPDFFKAKL